MKRGEATWMARKEYLLVVSDGGGGIESGNGREAPVVNMA